MKREECSHEWIIFPTYKQCKHCGEIIQGKQMLNVTGIICEDTDNSLYSEDEGERQDVLPKNDKYD